MVYLVKVSARAERDLRHIFDYINAADSIAAHVWFARLEALIQSLSAYPERGKTTDYDPGLRFLLYGNKPYVYRVLYRIKPRLGAVIAVHIRHGARQPLTR